VKEASEHKPAGTHDVASAAVTGPASMDRARFEDGTRLERLRGLLGVSPTLPATLGAGAALVLLTVSLTLSTDTFFRPRNLSNIMISAAVFIILGVGQALVMNTGGIDVSIGSTVALSASFLGSVIVGTGGSVGRGISTALLIGVVAGAFNGLVIVFLKIPPIIATLGTLTAYRGLTFVRMGPTVYRPFPPEIVWFGRGRVLGVPVPVLLAGLIALWGAWFLRNTRMGRGMTALGGDERSARVSGVAIDRYRIMVYTIMGLLSAVAAIVHTGRLDAVTATTAQMWELHTIALVVIGGTALFGGQVTIAGVVIGGLILGVLENGLMLLGLSAFWQRVFLGLVVIVAVGVRTYKNLSPMGLERS
jgi:ribose/xylose/arabinose/galactoside ABC-type transport system permease subunit